MGDEAVVTTGGTLSGMLRLVVVVEPYATLLNTAAMLFSKLAPSSVVVVVVVCGANERTTREGEDERNEGKVAKH